jgi:hypothetical protein
VPLAPGDYPDGASLEIGDGMTYPQQPGNWNDPSSPAPQPVGYPDPAYQAGDTPDVDKQPETEAGVPPQPGSPQPGALPSYGGYPPHYVVRRPMNNMALAALIVGLVSLFSCPLIGAVAVYLGNRARAEIRSSGEEGDGLALAGLIVGWVAVGLSVLMVLFFVVYLGIIATMVGTMSATTP